MQLLQKDSVVVEDQSREWWSPVGQIVGGRLSIATVCPMPKDPTSDNASIVAQIKVELQRQKAFAKAGTMGLCLRQLAEGDAFPAGEGENAQKKQSAADGVEIGVVGLKSGTGRGDFAVEAEVAEHVAKRV